MIPTSVKSDKITFEEVREAVCAYINDEQQLSVINKAYEFARLKHAGQVRKSGEPYIIHPLNVALILAKIYADYETISAGLMHDVLEDCDCSVEEMEDEFGVNITRLVTGVTRLSRINFSTENEYLIDYYKKIIVGMSEDVRVIIIKLADCLHNMRTLWALPEDRQKAKAHETLDIFAPIAHHLGIHKIKSELEDLSLRYLKPDVFYDIAEKLNKTKLERDKTVFDMQKEVSELLDAHHINHEIKGRAKSIYSIYNKLDKGKKFSDIYDLLALRILVHTEQECYLALGIIHSKFRPLPKRFKDYIAMPKPNMYQSLHTTVFGIDGYLFEIQIRTYDMDEVAENGIASHWAYKEGSGAVKADILNKTEQKLQFFKSIIDLSRDKMSSEEFVNSVKDELLNNNIYCFTPKGDVIELPVGATPLDFAYKIHTRVGETTVGAIVNNNIVPLDYELKNNDIVKINTNKSSNPSKEWINMVKTTQARNKIKSFFTKNEREVYIERGKDSIEKELRKRKLAFASFFTDENIKKICDEINCLDLDEIYLMAGNGRVPVNTIINIIDKSDEVVTPKNIKITSSNTDADIIVTGIDKVKVNLANCCNPVYGDEIIGYITKGNGISVHRINCHNLEMLEDRTLEVVWGSNSNKRYYTSLVVYTNTSDSHMLDLMQSISMLNISVDEIKTISRVDNILYEVGCYVTGLEQLNKAIMTLNKANYIDKVERVMR
ncbi:MAG: bifunctional (p)ppGpp synthetase/guanosine-3',5'-bis(diphosphate) 3'-pyrophosphohydrolase [Bacilli bacterium]|nr:bifunctional (p)ppGpp synthetase/guanosine-3',5'-bis(diphosphate) 3'-pyrophosphohydrolase [Mycoplasmatota bacterium]MDD6263570.1 bifunctional (p)ppGpp synthetase/guanosine-3',5'-bis(diphosphate) 3'-pyrophosphohydrolase [bacterium]MEE0015202.1 bifunctional (p)ppGpp synthetase/guanosine-3',5'-bis(diphosphate) 3'-pyrophosphohydrolase [Bacilli bacterium]